jgi:hypothetical protein
VPAAWGRRATPHPSPLHGGGVELRPWDNGNFRLTVDVGVKGTRGISKRWGRGPVIRDRRTISALALSAAGVPLGRAPAFRAGCASGSCLENLDASCQVGSVWVPLLGRCGFRR